MRTALVAAAVVAAAGVAAPAQAATPRQHLSFDESATTSIAGLGSGCPSFTGTLQEQRHLEIEVLLKPDGTAQAHTLATAAVTLTPDDPGATSYSGGYTQRQTGSFTSSGDDDRVVTTTMTGVLDGSDGSSYRISDVAHFSLDAQGTVRSWFERMHCGG
jgi:hypothetical protein